jgi:hypothetical protein
MPRQKRDWRYWRDVWQRALNNAPRKRRMTWHPHISFDKFTQHDVVAGYYRKPEYYGNYASLALILGYPKRRKDGGGAYSVYNRIYTNLMRGSKPRDPIIRERLLSMAGTHGKVIGWMHMINKGIAHRYVNPLLKQEE